MLIFLEITKKKHGDLPRVVFFLQSQVSKTPELGDTEPGSQGLQNLSKLASHSCYLLPLVSRALWPRIYQFRHACGNCIPKNLFIREIPMIPWDRSFEVQYVHHLKGL